MMRAAALCGALLALAGCGQGAGEPVANIGDDDPATPAIIESDQPTAWSYAGTAQAPEARFGSGRDQPMVTLRCDRENQVLRIHLATATAPVAGTPLVVTVDGAAHRLEATPASGGAVAEVLLADPLLAAMAAPGVRLLLASGSEPALPVPGGAAVRRTVDACRRPVEVPIAGALFEGTLPCADCPAVDISIRFDGPEPGPGRYRLTKSYRDGASPVTEQGMVAIGRDMDGPVLRLDPDAGGASTWLDWPAPGVLLMRDPRGQPDPLLDRYPLRQR